MKFFYSNSKRFWELDFLRGSAVLFMIIFHVVWAAKYFNLAEIMFPEYVMFILGRTTAMIFLILVGTCLAISYSRTKENVWKKYVGRGMQLLLLGVLVTFVSMFLPSGGTVIFGVLHLIGISIILSIPFLIQKNKLVNLFGGIVAVILGVIVSSMTISSKWLIWLGFGFPGFYTVDYYPIFPWFGIVLIGIFIGNLWYKNGKRNFRITRKPCLIGEFLCLLGRNSLLIYFLHMIIILGFVYFLI